MREREKKLEDKGKCNACVCVYNAIDTIVKPLLLFFFCVGSQINTHTHTRAEQQYKCEKKIYREKHTHKDSTGLGK